MLDCEATARVRAAQDIRMCIRQWRGMAPDFDWLGDAALSGTQSKRGACAIDDAGS
jgi:hypothetical protein